MPLFQGESWAQWSVLVSQGVCISEVSFKRGSTPYKVPLKYPQCDDTKNKLQGQPCEGYHQNNQLYSEPVEE